jgi:hypothetical protein
VVAVAVFVAVGVEVEVTVELAVEVVTGAVAEPSSGSGVPGVCDGEGVDVDVKVGTISRPVDGVGEATTPSTVGPGATGDSSTAPPMETVRRPPGGEV